MTAPLTPARLAEIEALAEFSAPQTCDGLIDLVARRGGAIRDLLAERNGLIGALLHVVQKDNECHEVAGCREPGWDNARCGCALEARAEVEDQRDG